MGSEMCIRDSRGARVRARSLSLTPGDDPRALPPARACSRAARARQATVGARASWSRARTGISVGLAAAAAAARARARRGGALREYTSPRARSLSLCFSTSRSIDLRRRRRAARRRGVARRPLRDARAGRRARGRRARAPAREPRADAGGGGAELAVQGRDRRAPPHEGARAPPFLPLASRASSLLLSSSCSRARALSSLFSGRTTPRRAHSSARARVRAPPRPRGARGAQAGEPRLSYQAHIRPPGQKLKRLGYFSEKEHGSLAAAELAAAKAYDAAAREAFKASARERRARARRDARATRSRAFRAGDARRARALSLARSSSSSSA